MTNEPVPRARAVEATVAYLRVSKEEQARPDKTSLADQLARVRGRATAMGRSVGRVFEDAGASGGSANRPAFQGLLRFCEGNPRPLTSPGIVLVLNDSRWGRFPNPEEGAYWRVHLDRLGWKVRYAEGDDSDDLTVSSIQRALYGSQATAYREAIRRNAKQGAAGTAAQGWWGCEAPLGYRREAVNARTGRTRLLDIGERKAPDERVRLAFGPEPEVVLIRWLFESYAAGTVSLWGLCEQARARWPERSWKRTTLHAILRNPAYVGDVVWMRRANDAAGRTSSYRFGVPGQVVKSDAHPALVSRATFDAVQRRLAANRKETSPTAGGYPLSGLILCSACGCPYIGGGGRKGPPEDRDRYRFYREDPVERRVRCPGPMGTITKRMLEPLVLDAIGDVVRQPSVAGLIAEEFNRVLSATGDDQEARSRAITTQRERAEARRTRLLRSVADGLCSEAEAQPVLAECRRDIDTATTELEQLRFEGRQAERLGSERERLVSLALDFPALAKRLEGRALRELVRPWLQRATIDKTKRKLVLEIRRIPAEGAFIGLYSAPGRD